MASVEPKILIPYSEYQRLQTLVTKYEKLLEEHHKPGKQQTIAPLSKVTNM